MLERKSYYEKVYGLPRPPAEYATIQTREGTRPIIVDEEWCLELLPSAGTLRKYGLTAEAYLFLLWMQNGCCAICGRPPKARRLAIDHNHGKAKYDSVRGLLCYPCNYGIGVYRDDALRFLKAAIYLIEPPFTKLLAWAQQQETVSDSTPATKPDTSLYPIPAPPPK